MTSAMLADPGRPGTGPPPIGGSRSVSRNPFAAAPVRSSLLLLAIATTGVHVVLALGLRILVRPAVPRWQASLYWVDYDGGFVRRGLPGALLSSAVGHPPTALQVAVVGMTLTGVAIVALVALAVVLCRRAPTPLARLVLLAVVVVSPFTLTLVAWDPGRYDDVGFMVLAGLGLLGLRSSLATRSWTLPVVVAVATTTAVACEEFLVAFVVPVALLVMWGRGGAATSGRRRLALPLLAVAPAVSAAVLSIVLAAPGPTLRAAFDEAQRAGVRITARPWTNGVVTLDQSLSDAVAYVGTLSLWTRTLVPLGFACLYLLGAFVCWWCLGRPMPRLFGGFTLGYGALAFLLGLVGVDYRRWWAVAFVALLAALLVLSAREPDLTGRNVERRRRSLLVACLIAGSLVTQLMPLYPTWDAALGNELPPAIRIVEALAFGDPR